MRKLGVVAMGLLLVSLSCKMKSKDLKTDEDRYSYAVGQQIGKSMKAQGVTVDPDIIAMAMDDVFTDKKSKLEPGEIHKAMQAMQNKVMGKRRAKGAENKQAGVKFLEANKKKKGVKVTASGLQYEIVKAGKGKKPKASDVVKVHYRGTLTNGTEFDSSYKRKEPAQFPVGGVIKGWTEALQLMKTGAKWKLTIPSELAYGEMGRPSIPPNSVLIFDVELIEIVKK